MDLTILEALSVEELEQVKAKVAELIKNRKAAEKAVEKTAREKADAERAAKAIKTLEEGRPARFIYKGEEVEAIVEKIGAKTITVQINDEPRYIKFEKIL